METVQMAAEEQALLALNREFGEAERRREISFFRRYLADGFIFRRASGVRVNKEQYLVELMDGHNTYERLASEGLEAIMLRPNLALISLRVQAKGRRGDVSFEGVFRNTRLFLKTGTDWQCAVWFNTREEASS